MKRRLRRVDPGLLVALAICLLAIWPFVSRSDLPQATDAELHIFRLAELSRLVRAGELFPRWAPNFYYGYGYPIFNYYAPLAYYAGLIAELLLTWNAVDATKFVFLLAICLGGLGAYAYSARNWGRLPALVAMTAYVYAPFVLFVDPYARGDLAESLSFGLFPVALWALDRLRTEPRPSTWLTAVAAIALLVLSHNLMALVFVAILVGWCIWVHLSGDVAAGKSGRTDVLARVIHFRLPLALLLGISLTAFFWLVVALEQDAVNLGSLIGQGDNFDFRTHFLTLRELLSPATVMDWAASEPDYVLSVGIVQWLLAGAGLVSLIASRSERRTQSTYFAVVAIVLLLLMLPISRPVWELVPLLPFLQFPWRLLGPMAFALAVLAAAASAAMMQLRPRGAARWLPVLLVGLIMVSALPLIQVPPWPPDFGSTSAVRVLEEELAGRWLGTTSTSDFVPVTVDKIPGPQEALLDDFAAGRPLDRVNRHTLPPDSTVRSHEITPLHFRYEVSSPSGFLLRLYLFEFPGWEVTIDGQAGERELGRPEGFIVVPVPAGQHVVEVRFGATLERQLAYVVSALSGVIVFGYAILLRLHGKSPPAGTDEQLAALQGGPAQLLAVAFLAILLVVLNGAFIEPNGWLRHESPVLTAIPAEVDQFAEVDGQIALIGYDVPATVRTGEIVPVTLYWQALRSPEANYQVYVHLLSADGRLVAQSDKLNPGDFPTENWPTDQYVRDTHEIALPGSLAPGEYHISVGLWLAEQGLRLPIVDEGGRALGDSLTLSRPLLVK